MTVAPRFDTLLEDSWLLPTTVVRSCRNLGYLFWPPREASLRTLPIPPGSHW